MPLLCVIISHTFLHWPCKFFHWQFLAKIASISCFPKSTLNRLYEEGKAYGRRLNLLKHMSLCFPIVNSRTQTQREMNVYINNLIFIAGITHRDLKPDNIILQNDEEVTYGSPVPEQIKTRNSPSATCLGERCIRWLKNLYTIYSRSIRIVGPK